MSKAEKYLPFILAATLPAMSIVANQGSLTSGEWTQVAFRYLEASVILIILWFSNKWLLYANNILRSKIGLESSVLAVNVLIILSISLVDLILLPFGLTKILPFWLQTMRLTLAAIIFNIILRIFKAQKESAQLKFQNLSLQAENLKFQMELFKQQVNPHFLFNSLNTLLDLIEEDKLKATNYVRRFSNLYRVVLQSSKHDFIPLKDELKFLDDYWNLLKVRFNDAIDLKISISEAKIKNLIPPLSLQFLIENAVKHNEASKKNPLTIEIREDKDHLIIRNKVNPKSYPADSERLGLMNLQQRFTTILKPIQYGIKDDYFIVSIPLKTS
jgi:sensor histidine kinase YesM